jgi:hypothetical protein
MAEKLEEEIASKPKDLSYLLTPENEDLVVEFGKHSKKLEEILTEEFCTMLKLDYSDKATLEKSAGDYYKGLLARGFFTPEEYEIVDTVHPLYKKQNLTAEENIERAEYNTKRTPLVRKLRTHFNNFLDIVFRPRNKAAAEVKKATEAAAKEEKRLRSAKKTPATAESKEEPTTEPVVEAVVEEPLRQMADLSMNDEVKHEEPQAEEPKQEEAKQEATEAAPKPVGRKRTIKRHQPVVQAAEIQPAEPQIEETKEPQPIDNDQLLQDVFGDDTEPEEEEEEKSKAEPDEDYEEVVQKDNEETKEMREQGKQKYALFEPAEHCFLGLGVEVKGVKLIIDPFCGKSKSVASYFGKKKPDIAVASYDKYYNKYFDFFDEAEWADLYDALVEDHDITAEDESRDVCLVCCPPRNAIAAFFDRVLHLECSFLVLIPTSFLVKSQMKMLMAGKSGMLLLCGAIKLFDVRKNKHLEEDMCWIWHAEHLHSVKCAAIYMTLDPALDNRIIEKCRLEQEEDKKKKALDDAKV